MTEIYTHIVLPLNEDTLDILEILLELPGDVEVHFGDFINIFHTFVIALDEIDVYMELLTDTFQGYGLVHVSIAA